MALTSKQKAAMLLMSLDVATANELVKGLDPKVVQELAVELTYLDAAGLRSSKTISEIARQFYNCLQNGPSFHLRSFLKEMLRSTIGEEKAVEIPAAASYNLWLHASRKVYLHAFY